MDSKAVQVEDSADLTRVVNKSVPDYQGKIEKVLYEYPAEVRLVEWWRKGSGSARQDVAGPASLWIRENRERPTY